MEKSFLMCDGTEGNGKAEIVMDYIMSYSLRHAANEYFNKDSKLCQYCRYMLGKLIDFKITNTTNVKSVKIWKEWQYIDLCVEVVITDGKKNKKFALLIENKYYSLLHDNQLSRYKAIFDKYYNEKEWNRVYKMVTCNEKKDIKRLYGKELAKTPAFKALSFYDLLTKKYWHADTKIYEDTESDIFNEFWLRYW